METIIQVIISIAAYAAIVVVVSTLTYLWANFIWKRAGRDVERNLNSAMIHA